MNKFDATQTGGHPLTLDDVFFLQESWIEAFKAVSNLLNINSSSLEPTYIIAGCVKTNPSAGVWNISEGFMVIKGEVCYVPTHTVSFSDINAPLFWVVEQSIAEPSPVQYKDFNVKDVHLQRVAKVTTTSTDIPFNPEQNVANLLDKIQRGQTGTLTLINGWNGNVTYRIIGGRIYLFGNVSADSNTVQGSVICEIPAELCPWIRIFDDYAGLGPATDSLIAAIIALDVAINGGNLYQSTRLQRLSSENNVINTTTWPLQIEPQNLTSAPPRTAKLKVWKPVNIPSGYDYVIYNLTGMSWDIAPRI